MAVWGPKDPDAIRDYGIDWTADMPAGATIVTSTWLLNGTAWAEDAELEKVQAGIADPAVRTIVRIGAGVLGQNYLVTNHVVFSNGEEDDKTEKLPVRAR
jgi:hypothetical protein